ncbi:UNVERIFIED_CONTAM: hypothetical protein NCL1_49080 [Trichonephila clavipes]
MLRVNHYEIRELYQKSYNMSFFHKMERNLDFVTCTIVRAGCYLSHCSYKAVTNSWFQCKQDAISNKIPPKIKTDHLKFKLEVVEALAASPSANKSISTDENNSVVRERFHSQKDQSVMIHMLEISCLLSWPFQKKKALPV